MPLFYVQRSGRIIKATGVLLGMGYSGDEDGLNNPAMQDHVGHGPIPRGRWLIGKPYTHTRLGPVTMNLDPAPGTDARGRSEFRLHGDNIAMNHTASHGCIVAWRGPREQIAASYVGDYFDVVAEDRDVIPLIGVHPAV